MQNLKLLRDVWDLMKVQLLQFVAILALIYVFLLNDTFNVLVFVLIILVTSLIVKLGREMGLREKPSLKDWLVVTIPRTIVLTLLFVLSIAWLGGFGLLGFILIFVVLAVSRIAFGWKIYDLVTSWGAARIKGFKGDIDLKKDARYYDEERRKRKRADE